MFKDHYLGKECCFKVNPFIHDSYTFHQRGYKGSLTYLRPHIYTYTRTYVHTRVHENSSDDDLEKVKY